MVLRLLQTAFVPVDLEGTGLSESLYYGAQIGGQVICNAICDYRCHTAHGHNAMMDDSSLWG